MWLSIVTISLLLNILLITCQQEEEEDSQQSEQQNMSDVMRHHDGVKRVVAVSEKNLNKILKKNELVVMMFWIDNGKDSEKLSEKDENFLEVMAQLFVGRKVAITSCEIMSNQGIAKNAGVTYTGMIKIFNKGRTTTYYGQRSTDVLFPYVAKMMTPALHIVQTKAEKKQYDTNDLPKVIAYVEPKSKELKELNKTALNFQPMIPFYVVFDAKLAKLFHLKKLNSLQLVKPYEKAVTYSSKKGITEQSVVAFVHENKKQRITKMRLENLHQVWAIDGKGFVVPVFAVTTNGEGTHFFSLAKSLAKHFEKNENVSFVWIDPDPFPAMVDYWSRSFKIDPSKPTIGVVDVHAQTSAWYPKPAEGGYVQNDIKKWILNVLDGKVELIPISYNQDVSEEKQNEKDEQESEVNMDDYLNEEEYPTKQEL